MDYITINKTDYPVKFGLSVIRNFAESKGFESLGEFETWYETIKGGTPAGIKDTAHLLLMGIQRGCRKENKTCAIDLDDMVDLMLENPSTFAKMMEIFSASLQSAPVENSTEAIEEEPDKKKES